MTEPRIIVVTGGASGMGAATARAFAATGATVVILDRDRVGAEEVAASVGAPEPMVGDVSDSGFCDQSITSIVDTHGRLDVLVNCAGVIHRAAASGTDDDDWRRVMGVNVDGLFYMSRAAIAPMKTQGNGVIVNFGSIWGGVGAAGVLAYCASKGAVHQITRAMALDHADDGIRINAVAPGEINTPMLAAERDHAPSAGELDALAQATIPMRRLGLPEEVASVVVFLASDDASYMTGSIVNVDAGYTAR